MTQQHGGSLMMIALGFATWLLFFILPLIIELSLVVILVQSYPAPFSILLSLMLHTHLDTSYYYHNYYFYKQDNNPSIIQSTTKKRQFILLVLQALENEWVGSSIAILAYVMAHFGNEITYHHDENNDYSLSFGGGFNGIITTTLSFIVGTLVSYTASRNFFLLYKLFKLVDMNPQSNNTTTSTAAVATTSTYHHAPTKLLSWMKIIFLRCVSIGGIHISHILEKETVVLSTFHIAYELSLMICTIVVVCVHTKQFISNMNTQGIISL